MKLSLRSKILILFILVSLVPLSLVIALGGYFINLTQRHSVAQLEKQLLTQKEKEIEKFIADIRTLLAVQVAVPVAALSGVPQDQREFLLSEMTKANKHLVSIALLEYDAAYPYKPENGMELAKIVGGELQRNSLSQKNSPQFAKAVKGEEYFGPVHQEGEEYLMAVAAPVKNKDGVVIGATSGEVSLKPVVRLVNEGVLGDEGYLVLTDHKGVIWAKPSALSFAGFGSNVFILSVLGGYTEAGLDELSEYVSSFGELVIASGKRLKDLDWVLAAEWPKRDAYAFVHTVVNQALIFLFIILGIVAVVSFLFALRIIRPIRTLEEGAKIIGGGNLNHRILINTRDELETLADRFNEMARNLKGIEELREVKARVQGLMRSLEREKELSQIKDQFIATASHQLRTPVTVIRWAMEGLRQAAAAGSKHEIAVQLESLTQNTEALALVIGDILTVAELGIGYTPKIITQFSLREKTKDALSKLAAAAEAKQLQIAFNAQEGEYRIHASEINIARALEQLIDNAVAYSHNKGHILIELSHDARTVTFSIRDDGIGVPLEDQKFVFQEFFRGRNSMEKKNVGTGLGLFIVKTIIEGHGGRVGVESPADWGSRKAGSRFYFTLPVR